MSHKSQRNARIRARIPEELSAYAADLQPLVKTLRGLCDDATAAPSARVYARLYLRTRILRVLRDLDARINAATRAAPAPAEPPEGGAA